MYNLHHNGAIDCNHCPFIALYFMQSMLISNKHMYQIVTSLQIYQLSFRIRL